MASSAFGSKAAAKPHLVAGSGGIAGEIADLRKDVEEAFVTIEASGAGLTTIADAAGVITATTVETALQELAKRLLGVFTDAAAIQAMAAVRRSDGALAIATDTGFLWTFKTGSAAGASTWVLVPDNAGSGATAGRWLRVQAGQAELAAAGGAALVGVTDSPGAISGSTVEAGLVEVARRVLGTYANIAAIKGIAPTLRLDGSIALDTATGFLWTFKAADATANDDTWVLEPTDNGALAGRWLRKQMGVADLAASTGAALIGVTGGGTLQTKLNTLTATGVSVATKVVGFAALTDADGDMTINFAGALPANAYTLGGGIDVSAIFNNVTDDATLTADLGFAGDDALINGGSLGAVAVVRTPVGTAPVGLASGLTPSVRVYCDKNLNTLTKGSLTAYVAYVIATP